MAALPDHPRRDFGAETPGSEPAADAAGAREEARPCGRSRMSAVKTRAAPSAWPPPLLPLWLWLWLAWAPPGAGAEAVHVQAPAQVDGFLGGTATLPCHLPQLVPGMHVTQVMWQRQEPVGEPRRVATFHPSQGASFQEPKRMKFMAAKLGAELRDASLVVQALHAEDEGNYTCMFVTFPQGSATAGTRLHVLAQPQNQAKALEVTLSLQPLPLARCVSIGGRPPAHISWSSHVGGEVNNSWVPGPLPGTVTVTSLFTLVPSSQVDGENITCRVEHESFREPTLLPVTLAVQYPPEVSISGYSDNWYIGLSEATLNCDVRSNPKPTVYNWRMATGPLPPCAVARGHQLLFRNVNESMNATFICSVTSAIGTGQAEQTILVRAQKQSHPVLSLGVIALICLIVLAVGVAVSSWVWKKFCQRSKTTSTNEGIL